MEGHKNCDPSFIDIYFDNFKGKNNWVALYVISEVGLFKNVI